MIYRNISLSFAFTAFLFLQAWAYAGPGSAPLELSLEEAWDMALKNSSGIKSAEQLNTLNGAALKQANAMFMPRASFSGTFARSNDQVSVFGSKLRQSEFSTADFDINALNSPDSLNNFEAKISMSVPIFTSGMNIYSRKAAKTAVLAGRHSVNHHKADLKLNVAGVYYGIVSASDSLASVNEGIAHLENLEKSYKLIQAPNSATTTCFLLSQATRYGLEQKREAISSNIRMLKRSLKSMLEMEADDIMLKDKLSPDLVTDSPSQDPGYSREDVKSIELNALALRQQRKAVQSMFGPRLDFFTWYAVNTPNFKEGSDAYMLGLMLTLDLFDYSKYGKLDEIRARESQIRLAWSENLKNNRAGAEKAAYNLAGKRSELKFAELSLSKAHEALKFANLRYREGTLPLKDLSSAIASWVDAKVNVNNSLYSLVMSGIETKFERGEL